MPLPSTGVLIAAAATAVVAGCILFDRHRRSAPDFKEKLREKRRRQKHQAEAAQREAEMPSQEALQLFLRQRWMTAMQLLNEGNPQEAVPLICSVLRMHSEPMQLLNRLQRELPGEIYAMIIHTLQSEMQEGN
eukprot:m.83490 g.83490  ORF g.83490 m.83490 type:complete len:133 (+) comp14976_c0_seq2:198-596(+)